jgi:hypothetical protein
VIADEAIDRLGDHADALDLAELGDELLAGRGSRRGAQRRQRAVRLRDRLGDHAAVRDAEPGEQARERRREGQLGWWLRVKLGL